MYTTSIILGFFVVLVLVSSSSKEFWHIIVTPDIFIARISTRMWNIIVLSYTTSVDNMHMDFQLCGKQGGEYEEPMAGLYYIRVVMHSSSRSIYSPPTGGCKREKNSMIIVEFGHMIKKHA